MAKKGALPFDTFIEVEWEDAASNDGWIGKDGDVSPETVVSRGWLVKSTTSYLTIASAIHKHDDVEYGSTQTFPRGMIRKCRELKVSNARSNTRNKLHPKPNAKEVHREPGEG